MAEMILSVSQLNDYVRGLLSHDPLLRKLKIRGEVTGLKIPSEHAFFALKDASALVKCVALNAGEKIPFELRDGMQVVVAGFATLYTPNGQFQFIVQEVEPEGEGELFLRFALLQRKLALQGWFDEARKRPLPKYPRCVGIVTSESGAAIRDMLAVGMRRWPLAKLLLCSAQVQGADAGAQLVAALKTLERTEAEVIVVGRGGGAAEDLSAFNDESLAKALFECRVPVISAVGHETDFTIADFVADVRAPTPSAAMELCLPDADAVRDVTQMLLSRLHNAARALQAQRRHRLAQLMRMLAACRTDRLLAHAQQQLEDRLHRLRSASRPLCVLWRGNLQALLARLNALSPYAALERGYLLAYDEAGMPISRISQVAVKQRLQLCFYDGKARAAIEDVAVQPAADREVKHDINNM